MAARGSAEWKGDLKGGAGEVTVGDGVWSGPYSFQSRFVDDDGTAATNPEQLIAAAHAACYSMALGNILGEAGTPATSIRTTARVQLRPVDGNPTIVSIALSTVGEVPGIDAGTFAEQADKAKAGCPVSRALASVPEITLEASLA